MLGHGPLRPALCSLRARAPGPEPPPRMTRGCQARLPHVGTRVGSSASHAWTGQSCPVACPHHQPSQLLPSASPPIPEPGAKGRGPGSSRGRTTTWTTRLLQDPACCSHHGAGPLGGDRDSPALLLLPLPSSFPLPSHQNAAPRWAEAHSWPAPAHPRAWHGAVTQNLEGSIPAHRTSIFQAYLEALVYPEPSTARDTASSSLIFTAPLIYLVGLFDLSWERFCREEACISGLQRANK